jgi:hypothetical protein
MPASAHGVNSRGAKVTEPTILPTGQLPLKAQKARNKDLKNTHVVQSEKERQIKQRGRCPASAAGFV